MWQHLPGDNVGQQGDKGSRIHETAIGFVKQPYRLLGGPELQQSKNLYLGCIFCDAAGLSCRYLPAELLPGPFISIILSQTMSLDEAKPIQLAPSLYPAQ